MNASLIDSLSPVTWASTLLTHSTNALTNIFSAKQTVRPDSFYQCLKDVLPSIKLIAPVPLWKLTYLWSEILGTGRTIQFKEQICALEILYKHAGEKHSEVTMASPFAYLRFFLDNSK